MHRHGFEHWKFWFLLICCTLMNNSYSQKDFLSLGCGREANFVSTDPKTNLTWTSDVEYISGFGRGSYVFSKRSYLRYFDEPKSCYVLPTTVGSFYLLRGSSIYANYDTMEEPPTFHVALDATLLHQISADATNSTGGAVFEAVFEASGNVVNYCLISVEGGFKPIISTLELRDVSIGHSYPYKILRMLKRVDCGNSKEVYRYPDDASDFSWAVDESPGFYNTSITYDARELNIPKIVLSSAAIANGTLHYEFQTYDQTASFYICMYFLELISTVKPGQRVFHIYANGMFVKESFVIPETGVKLSFEVPPGPMIEVVLAAAAGSTQGPLLNALEIYQIITPAAGTRTQDVNALLPMKTAYSQLKWSGDPCLPLNTSWDGLVCKTDATSAAVLEMSLEYKGLDGQIPQSINQLQSLTNLILDGNTFNGPVPDLRTLSQLENLELENNNLGGTIPDYFAEMPKLKTLYLQDNNLSGAIPPSLLTKKLDFRYSGNQFLTSNTKPKPNSILLKCFLAGIVGGLVMLFVVASTGSFLLYRQQHGTLPQCGFQKGKFRVRHFTMKEIAAITKNSKILIGEGGFGSVYYGSLPNGQAVAVKIKSLGSVQGTREFNAELKLLTAVKHENLVPLLGFCSENEQQILVYPFMSNGSLQDLLYGEGAEEKPINWSTRLSIALDAAKAISFLHHKDTPVIHRDIKTSNILLDENMRARVSDFGFSRFAPEEGGSSASLEVRGTAGYLDPEYYSTQRLTVKSDIYSFGVVLLEIITGREPLCISRPRAEWSLVEWATPFIQDANIMEIVDPAIVANYNPEAMWRVLEVALQSVHPEGRCRPSMDDIIRELEDALIIQKSNAFSLADSISMTTSVSTAFSHTMEPLDAR